MNRRTFLQKGILVGFWGVLANRVSSDEIIDSGQNALAASLDSEAPVHPLKKVIEQVFEPFEVIKPARGVNLFTPERITYKHSVPIRVEALGRKDIEAIALFIDNNPDPLVVVSSMSEISDVYLSVRATMTRASRVRAIIKTDKQLEEINVFVNI